MFSFFFFFGGGGGAGWLTQWGAEIEKSHDILSPAAYYSDITD